MLSAIVALPNNRGGHKIGHAPSSAQSSNNRSIKGRTNGKKTKRKKKQQHNRTSSFYGGMTSESQI
jgi:hypothetical protein